MKMHIGRIGYTKYGKTFLAKKYAEEFKKAGIKIIPLPAPKPPKKS